MRTSNIDSGRSDNNYFAKRRIRLMEKNPYCHWCSKKLTLYPNWPEKTHQKMPNDYPTIDHLESRFFGPRKDTKMKKVTLVLACPACNKKRQQEEHAKYGFRTRWKSGSFPYPFRWLGNILKWHRRQRRTTCLKGHLPKNRGEL